MLQKKLEAAQNGGLLETYADMKFADEIADEALVKASDAAEENNLVETPDDLEVTVVSVGK